MLKLFRANYAFFIPYLLLLVLVGLLQVFYSKIDLFLIVNSHHHPIADYFFRYFTHVGDGLFSVGVALLLLFVRFRYALMAAISFTVSGVFSQLLKRFVFEDSLRPTKFLEQSGHQLYTIEGLEIHSFNSFPSGHSTTAFAIMCLLALIVKVKRLGFLFLLAAALTAFSRVYLAQHFVADIYVGSFIGVLTSLATYYWLEKYFQLTQPSWASRSLWRRGDG